MIRRFSSGSSTPARRARNRSRASTITRFIPRFALERDAQELRLALAHEPVVDVDAGQPVADRTMDERRRDRRVHAARQRADDLAVDPVSAAWASTRSRISATVDSMKFADVQAGSAPAMPRTKLRSTSRPRGRVDDLGMELDAVEVAGRIGEAGVRRRVGLRRGVEAVGQPGDRVAVAHPDRLLAVEARRTGRRSAVIVTVAGPYSRFRGGTTSPPSSCAMSWAP